MPDNATLVFSFVGYVSQEIAVGNQTIINIVLASDIKILDEVVVVGYGEQRRKDLTGSVAQVSAKDFNPGINTNALQSIQGKVAGLTITQADGDPNSTPTVKLRGYTSLAGGGDPLYVVDGVIGVPINSISPNDISTMDVLKDASAAAIYGARAANGVIIITTKRGSEGKATVTFNNYVATEVVSKKLDLLDAQGYRDAVSKFKGAASLSDVQRFPVDANGKGYNTDWMKEIGRVGYSNNHELGISGGGSTFSYRGSLNYINRTGIIKNTGFERVNGRINIDQKSLNNRLSIQYNLSVSNTTSKLTNNGIIANAILMAPTVPVYNPDGSFAEVGGSFNMFNPIAMLNNYKDDQTYRVLIGGVNMKYEILEGLKLGVNGAFKNENTITSEVYNNITSNGQTIKGFAGNNGFAQRRLNQTNNKLLELTASYNKTFLSNSNFTVLGGYSYQINVDDGFNANNNNFTQGLYDLISYNSLGAGKGTLLNGSNGYTGSYKNEYSFNLFFWQSKC